MPTFPPKPAVSKSTPVKPQAVKPTPVANVAPKAAAPKAAPAAKRDLPVVTVVGRLGRDAEVKTVGEQVVCEFSIAVDDGVGQDKVTTWYKVASWNGAVEKTQHLAKGDRVVVKGTHKVTEKDGKTYHDVSAFFVLRAVEIEAPEEEMPGDAPEDEASAEE
jgi:hypothetical protein